jgi:hypothetical protein
VRVLLAVSLEVKTICKKKLSIGTLVVAEFAMTSSPRQIPR